MPRASTMPMPLSGAESFMKGISTGSDMFQKMMAPEMQRQNMAREWKQHQDNLQIQKQQQARLAQLFPLEQQLKTAQAQKAQADAAWTNMLMGGGQPSTSTAPNLGVGDSTPQQSQDFGDLQNYLQNIGMPIGGGQGMGAAPTEDSQQPNNIPHPSEYHATPHMDEQIISQGNPIMSQMDRFAGYKGIPKVDTHYDDNGNLITRYPSGKTTLTKVSPSKVETTRATEFAKGDVKLANGLTENRPTILNTKHIYQRYHSALSDPMWREMQNNALAQYGTNWGRKLNLAGLKEIGTPEQKELIGRVQNLNKGIVADAAKMFKGPFRVTEQSLVEDMKPSDTDPVDVAMAKLDEMERLVDYQDYISQRVPNLIRSGRSAPEAFDIAMSESGANKFVGQMQDKYQGDKTDSAAFDLNQAAKSLNVAREDIEHTAQLRGMTPEQVVRQLKQRMGSR